MATPQTGAGDPKRSLELLWREFEPQATRPGPKPKLTIDQIAKAAIAMADRDGIGAVNMRDIAAELGVGTMTLYRYLPGKAELLDLMVDRAGALDDETEAAAKEAAPGHWRQVLEALADSSLEFYRKHPWMLEINQSRAVLGPGGLGGIDFTLRAFDDHDLPDKEQILVVTSVWNIVTGTALSYFMSDTPADQGGPVTTAEEWWAEQEPYLIRAVASGHYPRLARIEDHAVWDTPAHEAMRHTLDAYLDGIAPRMEACRKREGASGAEDAKPAKRCDEADEATAAGDRAPAS